MTAIGAAPPRGAAAAAGPGLRWAARWALTETAQGCRRCPPDRLRSSCECFAHTGQEQDTHNCYGRSEGQSSSSTSSTETKSIGCQKTASSLAVWLARSDVGRLRQQESKPHQTRGIAPAPPVNLLRSADDSGPLWNMLCNCRDGMVSNDARPATLPRPPAAHWHQGSAHKA